MTIFIKHRVNDLLALTSLPKNMGAEIDVRYHLNDLVVTHDAFHGEVSLTLDAYLKKWSELQISGPLILNTKSEGLEQQCLKLLNLYKITNWFFLDLSMPYFVKYALLTKKKSIANFTAENLATRFSEFEPIEYALAFSSMAAWVWIDCFTKLPLNRKNFHQLKQAGFKLCLVSPELQGHGLERIEEFKKILNLEAITMDAICTKRIDLWSQSA